MSSLSSSGVGGAGSAGRSSSPRVNSQGRQDPGPISDALAYTGVAAREKASAAPPTRAEPTKDRRVRGRREAISRLPGTLGAITALGARPSSLDQAGSGTRYRSDPPRIARSEGQ